MTTAPIATPAASRGRIVAYWVTTILVVLMMIVSGFFDVTRGPAVVEIMTKLGYPTYMLVILGTWKTLGGLVLLAPKTPRLKEWAYAGTIFDLTGAAASHIAVGDSAGDIATPLILTLVAVASWALRPPSRRLSGPLV